ncbi:hypothetical protein niasHT_001937 [Heterodera trifolii]|uniref:Phosphoinositide phospholipase C n=1 Tax=Heterodera trifolii TaxID=157864 RepID=A0ABD2LSF3_9BILA
MAAAAADGHMMVVENNKNNNNNRGGGGDGENEEGATTTAGNNWGGKSGTTTTTTTPLGNHLTEKNNINGGGGGVVPFDLPVRRVKNGRISGVSRVALDIYEDMLSYGATRSSLLSSLSGCRKGSAGERRKKVILTDVLEIRQGYRTDGLHKAAKDYKFQRMAPEQRCFSIICKHPRFVCKSLDFVAVDLDQTTNWLNLLQEHFANVLQLSQNAVTNFNEQKWLLQNFRQADLNRNNEISFGELWRLLKRLNLQLSDQYVEALFKESVSKSGRPRNALNEQEFLRLFSVLTDLPEYRSVLRLANGQGNDFLDAETLRQFLTEEQQFKDVDQRKAEAIIAFCEPANFQNENQKDGPTASSSPKVLSVSGFRRLLQCRWGNILREGHETVFQQMDQPLQCYFINSSHNTYLTGLQVHGNATVEGYISALRRGSRLLELDVFDGEHGEPQITHKRTFIGAISLRNVLKCVKNYAFVQNPYPVILTIENHVGIVQQRIMADIFQEILGDHLLIPTDNFHTKPLPSPQQLKHKVLLRGKTSSAQQLLNGIGAIADTNGGGTYAETATTTMAPPLPRVGVVENNGIAGTAGTTAPPMGTDYDTSREEREDSPKQSQRNLPVDPKFGRLIALPSVKLSPNNLYSDIKTHPTNGSPSLSERKVSAFLEANAPMAAYTATRIVKSFPSGIRQDSSNLDPIPSWICGIQSAALNFQTCDTNLDLNKGFFSVNGNIGYILKPKMLLEGKDPRHITNVQCTMELAIICAQYLPKTEPDSNSIIDPYICVQIFGVPRDERKAHTRTLRNNGFNPVWNECFSFPLCCPELAILRVCVKDFDRTSSDDFVGEFSVPVNSIRPGKHGENPPPTFVGQF